ncbi:MAG: type II secretion system F family protein [Candidatus Solibacter usitatus]|nr:type II secretion system F family protein [Candidatus Solibacter usitatus]
MLLGTVLMFLVLASLFTLIGINFWARPKAAMERVTGAAMQSTPMTAHPSLAWHELVKKLGTLIPASPKDTSVIQRRLVRAGYRSPGAVKMFYGAKVALGLLLPLLTLGLILGPVTDANQRFMAIAVALAVGFLGPNQYLRRQVNRRQKQIRRGLPNALDLMVVCVESGLGLDQAVLQVAKELQHAHPEISEEFSLMNLELKAGKLRAEALRNLAARTGVDELKKLVGVLIQADRFGTSIAQSLRGHSEYMRVQTRQQAEEKAAKLGVKLVFPIFFCILPSLFVVTVGPVLVRITRDLIPMMLNM